MTVFTGVLIGAPGSGKGTQGEILANRLGIRTISTGDLLRGEVSAGSDLGKRVAQVLSSGGLVTDHLVNKLVESRIEKPDCGNGFLLDGYPRSPGQALYLDGLLKRLGLPDPHILHLQVPVDVLTVRLGGRRVCPACDRSYHISLSASEICPTDGTRLITRADDRMKAVAARLASYTEYERSLVKFYRRRLNYSVVDGTGTLEEVSERICAAAGVLTLAAA